MVLRGPAATLANSLSLKKVSLLGEASPIKGLSTPLFPAAYTATELLDI